MQKQQSFLPIYRVYRHGAGFHSLPAHSFLYLDKFIPFPKGVIQGSRIVCDDLMSAPMIEILHSRP